MNTIIAHPSTNDKVEALKAFLKALKISFEVTPTETYNPEFVAKIQKSKQQLLDGNVTKLNTESDIKNLLDL
jgi:hypothetical protein